jgi:hypothetical protein
VTVTRLLDVVRDLRYALRLLTRSPGYSVVVIAVLAIGIGVNIVAFGYFKALALTPLPGVRRSGDLHVIGALTKSGRTIALPLSDYEYLRDHSRTYAEVAGSTFSPFSLGTGAAAQRVYGEFVTGNYFDLLGVRAAHGRTIQPSDNVVPRGHPVILDGWNFYRNLQADLRTLDGVESVSLMRTPLLMVWDFGGREFMPEGYVRDPDEDMAFGFNIVAPDHFRTLRIPLVAGRDFQQDESAGRVTVVNETLARRYWGNPQAALGKRLTMAEWTIGEPVGMTVVGVARDIKYTRLNEEPRPYVYLPFSQAYVHAMAVHVRAVDASPALLERIRHHVRTADPNIAVLEAGMLADDTRLSFALYDAAARVLRIVGLAAIGLAALGIYGLVAYTVRQSTHEIGIRIAIGAGRATILNRYLMSGVRLGILGAAIGIAAAVAVTRLLTAILFGVTATDGISFAAATVFVVGAAAAASLVPAWRGSRVDPVVALRHH